MPASGQPRLATARRRNGRLLAVAASALTLLLAAAPARASVTISSFSISPSTTQAAAHPNVTISAGFSYSDSTDTLQSLQVYFPAGLLGNPNAASKCTTSELAADTCPASSQIGTVSVTALAAGIPLPVTAPGSVYLVTPVSSEPARIGMVVRPLGGVLGKVSMSGPVNILIPGDERLVSTFTSLPRSLPSLLGLLPIPITIQSLSLTLDGVPGGSSTAFMTNPTSCGAATGLAIATSYESSAPSWQLSSYTPSGCGAVPFNPGLSFSFGSPQASTPSSLAASVTVPAAEFPLRQSHVLASIVLLPDGTAINPAGLAGLSQCTDAELNVSSAAPASCPSTSQVGTATFSTPLLGDVPGQVFFATGTAANPLRLFVQLDVDGLYAKLIALNGFYGPFITSTLTNLPQVPFTSFTLSFSGGAHALLQTPACGTSYGYGLFVPWSGTPTVAVTSPVTISETSSGAACPSTGGSVRARAAAAATAARLRGSLRYLHGAQGLRAWERRLTRVPGREAG